MRLAEWSNAGFRAWCVLRDFAWRVVPLLMLSVLALLSHWLIQNAPAPLEPQRERQASAAPDYQMHHFVTDRYTPSGELRMRLQGELLQHLPLRNGYEVTAPRLEQRDDQGRLTLAVARMAFSNEDASVIELFDNAQITRPEFTTAMGQVQAAMRIRSDYLHYQADTEVLKTDRPVVIERGPDRFEGQRMVYRNLEQQLELSGAVKGRLAASTRR